MEPVIVIAFANNKDKHLHLLKRESSNIFNSLREHDDARRLKIRRLPAVTIEEIFKIFSDYSQQIAIFHYAGHAGAKYLILESPEGDQQLANAVGLADMMGLQKNLQLVFLNGCATEYQVKRLLASGVKAVMATNVPVNDHMATEFAEQFYHFLARGNSLKNAFIFARSFIDAKYKKRNKNREIVVNNGFNIEGIQRATSNKEFPWGLYLAGNNCIDTWKLPVNNAITNYFTNPSTTTIVNVEVNKKLFDTLQEKVEPYCIELSILKERIQKGEKIRSNVFRKAIIEAFPVPIGEQLRLLIDKREFNRLRLTQLVTAYNTTAQLILFAMLSQLWDAMVEDTEFNIHKQHRVMLNSFFAINRDNYKSYNFMELIETITGIFNENGLDFFVDQLKVLETSFLEQDEFYKAHIFMEQVKRALVEESDLEQDIPGFCMQSEEHLCTILSTTAFFAQYKLKTIKRIDVAKFRHRTARFRHHEVVLDKAGIGLEDDLSEYDRFSEHNSVILQKTDNDIQQYLNLSPFVIDENALNGDDLSRLFYYCYQDASDNCYNFKFIDDENEEKLKIPDPGRQAKHEQVNENYLNIENQIEAFKNCILRESK